MSETRTFIVPMDAEIVRIDKFLSAQMPEFSRSEIQKFTVTRGGAPIKFSDKTRVGDVFCVTVPWSPAVWTMRATSPLAISLKRIWKKS